ncbi:MAG: RnfABCDGE type electron transport complex subunit D [Pseudomonadales bacterium]
MKPGALSATQIMWITIAALVPGALCQAWLFGASVVSQVLVAMVIGAITEAACTRLRGQPLARARLVDGSSALTAALIALALPPNVPLPVLAIAVISGLGLGKFAYGGLGNNLFNPAMVGYLVVLVSFPQHLASWVGLDGLSGATPLDQFSHRGGATVAEFRSGPAFGSVGGQGWEWINAGFALGGLVLIGLRIIHWRVPLALLASLSCCALLGYDNGSSSSHGAPLYHVFTGASCITAFFIATDPVTQPTDPRAQWLFGLLIGLLIYVIRSFGTYADGAAFAVLLANGCAPLLQARASRWQQARRTVVRERADP